MTAILKRELKAYFYSPIGYVFIGFFMALSGLFFSFANIRGGRGDLNYLFGNLILVIIVLIPILTMRLISEEKNNRTDVLLLTSPVSIMSIVAGKILSAFAVFAITLCASLIYPVIISKFTLPAWPEIIGIYIGFFLMGISFITIGIYISSLTENQIISAIATFVILFMLYIIYLLEPLLSNKFLVTLVSYLSIATRFNDFVMGIISIESVVYYLSIVALFGFLTVQQLEKRRWKK